MLLLSSYLSGSYELEDSSFLKQLFVAEGTRLDNNESIIALARIHTTFLDCKYLLELQVILSEGAENGQYPW